MGSSHFGDVGMGSGKSGSSRKGKKSNSDKPKQPQRGLGVAQLERIRLQNQLAGFLPSLQPPSQGNFSKDDSMRVELAFSSSPSSSSYTASPSSAFAFHPNIMMGFGETERTNIRYGEFHEYGLRASITPSMAPNNILQPHHFTQPAVTLPLMEQSMEDLMQKRIHHDRCHSTGSISLNSDSSDTQELDLDLKLSL